MGVDTEVTFKFETGLYTVPESEVLRRVILLADTGQIIQALTVDGRITYREIEECVDVRGLSIHDLVVLAAEMCCAIAFPA
jgi:hypothetical protein